MRASRVRLEEERARGQPREVGAIVAGAGGAYEDEKYAKVLTGLIEKNEAEMFETKVTLLQVRRTDERTERANRVRACACKREKKWKI